MYDNTLAKGTNRYFDQFTQTNEQDLVESLIVESIKIHGHDVYYLPRTKVSFDPIYGEDDISEFNRALPIEMYIVSVDGFQGDGVFLSQFGLEIRDQVTFSVARRVFNENITLETQQELPQAGDLIYFPLNGKCFEIRFVNYKEFFYQLGKLHTWELVCELYEYSNEKFNTGIDEIDIIQKHSTDLLDYALTDGYGNQLVDENGNVIVSEDYDLEVIDPGSDNDDIQDEADGEPDTEADDLINWSETDPFSNGKY